MNLVDKIKGCMDFVNRKDISKKVINTMMIPVAYFVIDKAINDYSPSVNLNSGTVYAADAMVTPDKPYKGMPLDLVMASEQAYLPDLSEFKEIKKKERKENIIKDIEGVETIVKLYVGDKYLIRTLSINENKIYGFSLTDRQTGKIEFFTDTNNDALFETKGLNFDLDYKKYNIEG